MRKAGEPLRSSRARPHWNRVNPKEAGFIGYEADLKDYRFNYRVKHHSNTRWEAIRVTLDGEDSLGFFRRSKLAKAHAFETMLGLNGGPEANDPLPEIPEARSRAAKD